jgi:hypothetical protein
MTKAESNDLLSAFRCEKESDGTYISSADLHIAGMPEQHIYATGLTSALAISWMLQSASETIREYFGG